MNRFIALLEQVHKRTDRLRPILLPDAIGGIMPAPIESQEEVPMWLQYLIRALSAIPLIVSGIEHIHGSSKTGAEKKAMAMDALGLSAAVAATVAPEHNAVVAAATELASQSIDGVVSVMNAGRERPVPMLIAAPQAR